MDTRPKHEEACQRSPPKIRLEVAHLLCVTGACAVAAAVTRGLYDPTVVRPEDGPFWFSYCTLGSLVHGVALGGAAVMAFENWRRDSVVFPCHPGHWFTLLFAGWSVIDVTIGAATEVVFSDQFGVYNDYFIWNSQSLLIYASESLFAYLILLGLKPIPRWRLPVIVVCLCLAVGAVAHLLPLLQVYPVWLWAFDLWGQLAVSVVVAVLFPSGDRP